MGDYYNIIIKVKPGLTGPWQIAGRSDVTFEDRLVMDNEYCKSMSIIQDIKIVMKTIIKVVKKDGAR